MKDSADVVSVNEARLVIFELAGEEGILLLLDNTLTD